MIENNAKEVGFQEGPEASEGARGIGENCDLLRG